MADQRSNPLKFETRDLIYGAILVAGFMSIFTGANEGLSLGLPEWAVACLGGAAGVLAAFGLGVLRKR